MRAHRRQNLVSIRLGEALPRAVGTVERAAASFVLRQPGREDLLLTGGQTVGATHDDPRGRFARFERVQLLEVESFTNHGAFPFQGSSDEWRGPCAFPPRSPRYPGGLRCR